MNSEMAIHAETSSLNCKPLYKLGGAAAIAMLAIIVIQFAVFIMMPPPLGGTAADWFSLFQRNPFIGLVDFELLMVIYTLLSIPITLALYLTLRRSNPSIMALYLALSLIGVIAFVAARPAVEMLYLSKAYAAATDAPQKSMLLASGNSLIATFNGTSFHVSYILGSVSGLLVSLVMLNDSVFSKATAYVRIASSLCDFGLYLPVIGMYISIFSVVFLFIWNFLIARRLFQLARQSAL